LYTVADELVPAAACATFATASVGDGAMIRCYVEDTDSRTREVKESTTAQGNWGIEDYGTRAGDEMLNDAHPKNVIGEANSMSDVSATELGTAPPNRYHMQFRGIVSDSISSSKF
jgi:hypothetical protein